jgi:hypothetical protein
MPDQAFDVIAAVAATLNNVIGLADFGNFRSFVGHIVTSFQFVSSHVGPMLRLSMRNTSDVEGVPAPSRDPSVDNPGYAVRSSGF